MRYQRRILIAVLLISSSVLGAFGQNARPTMSRDLPPLLGQSNVPVIIQYKVRPNADHVGRIMNAGGTVRKIFSTVQGIAATVPGSAVSSLAADPDVAYVSVDRPVASRTAWYDAEPINAPSVWSSGLDGTGIGVAVIDSGINNSMADLGNAQPAGSQGGSWQPSPWLPGPWLPVPVPSNGWQAGGRSSRVVFAHNFLTDGNGWWRNNNTNDQYGHGTHVAGIIGGNGTMSTGNQYFRTFKGIAPNVNLIDLQVLDQNGQGLESDVIAAIEMAIALQSTYNIRVINLSLGRGVYESYTLDPLCQAAEEAWKAGIVVVVAAGNDGRLENFNSEGYGTINAPGNDPYVITAGAVDTNNTAAIQDDTVASYSSKGPSLVDDVAKPDVMAPGSLIASLKAPFSALAWQNPTLVTLQSDYTTNGRPIPSSYYFPLSGTSMAAAVVSGASALLLQAQPNLTPDQVKALLMRDAAKGVFPPSSTVTDSTGSYTSYNDLLTVGAGYLDIQATVTDAAANAATLPTGYALSPSVNLDPTTGSMYLVFAQNSLWTYDTTWAPSAVYGSAQFQSAANGSTIPWGNGTVNGSTFIWGRASVAGSTFIWGRSDVSGETFIWGRDAGVASSTSGPATAMPLY
jgi:serine protease AprX